jgi:flagellar biosynthesis/type III secretory pathway ATPase
LFEKINDFLKQDMNEKVNFQESMMGLSSLVSE